MRSLAQKIALQFSFVLSLLVIILAIHFISVISKSAHKAKEKEIELALNKIVMAMQGYISLYSAENEIPYYLTYNVYEAKTLKSIATNAPFIPILPETEEKPMAYFEKDFFTDGDLNIIYATKRLQKNHTNYIIQISN